MMHPHSLRKEKQRKKLRKIQVSYYVSPIAGFARRKYSDSPKKQKKEAPEGICKT